MCDISFSNNKNIHPTKTENLSLTGASNIAQCASFLVHQCSFFSIFLSFLIMLLSKMQLRDLKCMKLKRIAEMFK